jgi:glycosyltransferase involved in cell wall biosynthesis
LPNAPASQPLVSVVISSWNRAGLLPRLIQALEGQTLSPDSFEVVIVDNASTDDTSDVLARLASTSSVALRWKRIEPNRGPASGRNAAFSLSTAPIIAFTDDDCVPDPGWLEAGLRALDAGRRVVVGSTRPNPEQIDLLARPYARTVTEDEGMRFYNTCNVFYRRADVEGAGGFDERFSSPGGEDTDLAWRVLGEGAEAGFAAEAIVYHDVHADGLAGAAREAIRWTNIPLVVARHPSARRLLHWRVFWKPSHPRALLAMRGWTALICSKC